MTISYNWLSEYLPDRVEPAELSKILTSVGLEVESLEKYEGIKGSLAGIKIGQVVDCAQHPNADKLKVAKVDIGKSEVLNIVCGAPNVATGQKVLVASVGTTIYPTSGDAITMKAAKIRGELSEGMICAEDEIGLGASHAGILILPDSVVVGSIAADYFKPYTDWIFEIGLTPNRMDAMSHYGVARDVCAYLTHHNRTKTDPKSPFTSNFRVDNNSINIKVTVENQQACPRYAGICIQGVTIKASPKWLQDKLIAIGQRPINNIVDITNYILHETGQPLHAFDLDQITGNEVIVKNLADSTIFLSLDEKERKLSNEDLMICNAIEGMCIAGVFGGAKSGVKETTQNIFLESAYFNPVSIRKTSVRHGLRTEAASRFEKGVDISNVVNVLKRASLLITEVAGGQIASDIIDIYSSPKQKNEVTIKYQYLKKLSGKDYTPHTIKTILLSLGFAILKEGTDELHVAVPFSKPDISLPADIVEEILRIDGLDNVEIKTSMHITPSQDANILKEVLREKISNFLTGIGCNEILTNSITNSKYFNEEQLQGAVKMINNLSADLDVLRPSMLETGLEAIIYNLNRKNNNLQFFEFAKTYHTAGLGNYSENEHLALYFTGKVNNDSWRNKETSVDFFKVKGIANAILTLCGIQTEFSQANTAGTILAIEAKSGNKNIVTVAEVSPKQLKIFDIKQPVYFIDFNWTYLVDCVKANKITYREMSKLPAVNRDLAIVVDKSVSFEKVKTTIKNLKLQKLQNVQLFDIFESDKLGENKKSLAISFTFLDEEKTLTDKEVDLMIGKIIQNFETELSAEIRK